MVRQQSRSLNVVAFCREINPGLVPSARAAGRSEQAGSQPAARSLERSSEPANVLCVSGEVQQDEFWPELLCDGGLLHCGEAAAIAEAHAVRPGVVILDRLRPRTSLELIQAFRGHRALRSVAIVVVSQWPKTSELVMLLGAGADEYLDLMRPPEEIRARVRRLVRASAREPGHEENGPRDAAEPLHAPRSAERVFRREGEYWTIIYDGATTRVRDSKGARYVAHLLMRPDQDVHVAELAQAVDGLPHRGRGKAAAIDDVALSVRALPTGDCGPRLDGRAKAEYRRRLDDIEEELREASAFDDNERAARAEAERRFVAGELAAAVGLGGRDRRAAVAVERVRVNVTRTIKALVQKARHNHRVLGRHLAASLRTGTFCSYAPIDGARDWHVSW